MSSTATRTIPAGGVACVSNGRCGDSTGWHYQGSDAQRRCARAAESLNSATDRMRDAVAAGRAREAKDPDRQLRPLRRMEHDEEELLESMRQTALKFLPFYSHMLYKVKPVAVDEDPVDVPGHGPTYAMRAGIMEDWRLLINFGWVRHEFDKAYEQYGDKIRDAMRAAGQPIDEAAVRDGSDMLANINMAKVLLHEMGHGMYNSWSLVEKQGLDADLLNRAEDAVINNSLRVLGSKQGVSMPNENIHGEFLEDAVYGGTVECDDPAHSWHYTDPKGNVSRRCSYDETTAHYYAALQKKQEEEQKSQQGSTGKNEKDSDSQAAPGQNGGQQKGREGGSSRERQQGGDPSSDPDGSSSPGQGQDADPNNSGQGGSGQQQSGQDSGDASDHGGCGTRQAQKYADDPLMKGEVSEAAKKTSLDVTASELERWADENEAQAKRAGFGTGSMARKWAQHRRKNDGIKWNSVLDRTVRRTVESLKTTRETYSKARRRDVANRGIIRRGTKQGYMPSIAAAMDTSASMSPDDLFMAYNSVRSVIKRTGITSLDAFAVDSEAKSMPVKIKKAEDIAPLLRGGGGTDMCAGIEVAAKNGNDACIVFTDGVVRWGAMETRPRHMKDMEVIIAIIADGDEQCQSLADKVPSWMKTVKINKELLAEKRNGRNPDDSFIG